MNAKTPFWQSSKDSRTWPPVECNRSEKRWPIYQFFFGKRAGHYRVLFMIEAERVLVLHIRRGTMDKATEADLLE